MIKLLQTNSQDSLSLSQTLSSQTYFLIPYLFHVFQDSCISGFTFFRLQVFLGPDFSGSRFSGFMFFRVHVFQDPGFSGSRFFRFQVFQDPGFSGSRFFRIRVQGPGPGFRSSQIKYQYLKRVRNPLVSFRSSNHPLLLFEEDLRLS